MSDKAEAEELRNAEKLLEEFQKFCVEKGQGTFLMLKEVLELSPMECFGTVKALTRVLCHSVPEEEYLRVMETLEHAFPDNVIDSILRGEEVKVISTDRKELSGTLTKDMPVGKSD